MATKKKVLRFDKTITVKVNSENFETLRLVLNANGIRVSSFVQSYIDAMADLVRACSLSTKPIKEFTVLEMEELFARMQGMLNGAKQEAKDMPQQLPLPGTEKASNG